MRKRTPRHPEDYGTPKAMAEVFRHLASTLEAERQDRLVAAKIDLSFWYADEGAPVPEVVT